MYRCISPYFLLLKYPYSDTPFINQKKMALVHFGNSWIAISISFYAPDARRPGSVRNAGKNKS